jgi:hypothetical protein
MTSLLPQKLAFLTKSQRWVLNCSLYAKIQTKLILEGQTDGRSAKSKTFTAFTCFHEYLRFSCVSGIIGTEYSRRLKMFLFLKIKAEGLKI